MDSSVRSGIVGPDVRVPGTRLASTSFPPEFASVGSGSASASFQLSKGNHTQGAGRTSNSGAPSNASSTSVAPPPPSMLSSPNSSSTLVLITSCVQNDFFHRFPRRRDSMNRYWVGRKDSERVLGFDPARGPLAQLMNFIRGLASRPNGTSFSQKSNRSATANQNAIHHPSASPPVARMHDSATQSDGSTVVPVASSTPEASPTSELSLEPSEDGDEGEVSHQQLEDCHPSPHADDEDELNHEVEEDEEEPIHLPVALPHQNPKSAGPTASLATSSLRIDLHATNIHHSANSTVAPSSAMQLPRASSILLTPTLGSVASPPPHSMSRLPSGANFPIDTTLSLPPTASILLSSPRHSPVAPITFSSRGGSTLINVIHLRASIDPTKNRGRQAIERYGEYCLAGTEGARLCCGLEDDIGLYPNECIIDTTRTLSSNSYRPLLRKLREIAESSKGPLRVAVIGGWTDEDVYHLCYELKTRTKAIDIATCSVLTASPSTSQHWNALGQMKRVMGVTVTRTVRELVQWFGVGGSTPYTALQSLPSQKYWPNFLWNINGQLTTTPPADFRPDSDGEILAHLYRNSSKIIIDILVGDFRRAVVLTIRSYDKAQVREAPSILKISRAEDIATEYQAFHRVEEMLGNNAPMVRGFVELGDRAGIKFRYTRMTGGKVCSMADLFNDLAVQVHTIRAALDEVFQEIFNPWYAGARLEFFDLFAYYFDGYTLSLGREWNRVKKVDRVHCDSTYLQQFITYVLAKKGTDPAPSNKHDRDIYQCLPYTAPTFTFPLCDPLTNLAILFDKPTGVPYLRTLPPTKCYSCFSHGNASLENFMCEGAIPNSITSNVSSTSSTYSVANTTAGRVNVWIVDFFYTEARNHVLRDLARTWCCIMYSAAEITNDHQFSQAIMMSQEMAKARDLALPLPNSIPGLTDIHLRTIYGLLLTLWSHAGRMVKDRSSATQFQIALLADSMRFFLYQARNIYSKRWALSTAVMLLEAILIQEKRYQDIKPTWISLSESTPLAAKVKGKLGITRCPGHRDFMLFEKRIPDTHSHAHGITLAGNSSHFPSVNSLHRHVEFVPGSDAVSSSKLVGSALVHSSSHLLSKSDSVSPVLRAARYSATNPSLLPPNEDRRREEQKEREEVIREQQEQQAKEEEEEEKRANIQAAEAAAVAAAAGIEPGVTLPSKNSPSGFPLASPSPSAGGDMMSVVDSGLFSSISTSVPAHLCTSPPSVSSAAAGLGLNTGTSDLTSPGPLSLSAGVVLLSSEERSRKKKLEAEAERAKEHARVLVEQEAEAARYARKQAQKRAADHSHAASNTSLGAVGTAASLTSPPIDELADAEIEEEMRAAAEAKRLHDAETAAAAAATHRPEPSSRYKTMLAHNSTTSHAIPASTSSCDLSVPIFPFTTTASNTGLGMTTKTTSHTHTLPASISSTLPASFSSPHLSTLANSNGGHASVSARAPPPHLATNSYGFGFGMPASSAGAAQLSRIQREVSKLARAGTTHILLLLSESDCKEIGVDSMALRSSISAHGMKQLRVELPAGPFPMHILIDLVQVAMGVLCDASVENQLVVISKSGFHRAGTLAACILCAFGLPVDRSVRMIRDARGTRSLGRESRDQLVSKFDVAFKRYLIQKVLHSGELFQTENNANSTKEGETTSNQTDSHQSSTFPIASSSNWHSTPPVANASSRSNPPLLESIPATTSAAPVTTVVLMPETPASNGRSLITVWPVKQHRT